jgi:hypothetical protein
VRRGGCRPPRRPAGSWERWLRPCRWVGLPRRIPFVRRTPAAAPSPVVTGRSSDTDDEGLRHRRSSVPCLLLGRAGRLSIPAQARTIARLGRFSTQLPSVTDGDLKQDAAVAQLQADQLEDARASCSTPLSPSKDCCEQGAVAGATCLCPCQVGPDRGRRACPAACPILVCFAMPLVGSVWRLGALIAGGLVPLVRFPEPATRDAGGWLLGRLAASAAPRARPGAATAVLVWASSTTRPRATPMTVPSRAPTTTKIYTSSPGASAPFWASRAPEFPGASLCRDSGTRGRRPPTCRSSSAGCRAGHLSA